jgi:hypothetical protein
MKKFTRQKSGNAPIADINLDFGAAAAKVARVFEPGEYKLRIESARVIPSGQNILVALDLVMAEGGDRVASRPLWVDGPNAGIGPFAAENLNLVAQLLALAAQPTTGNPNVLIPKLTGLEFDARLGLAFDNRSGRTYNTLAAIYRDGAP